MPQGRVRKPLKHSHTFPPLLLPRASHSPTAPQWATSLNTVGRVIADRELRTVAITREGRAALAREAQQHAYTSVGSRHTIAKRHRKKEARGSARERGYTTAWDKFSQAYRRLHPVCEYCEARGKTVAADVVDHDMPHNGDPDLFWDNTFTSLCAPCHNGPKASAEARLDGDDLLAWVARQKAGGGSVF